MPRVFLHAPLPPVKSGIADYTAEILSLLASHVDLTIVDYADGSRHDRFPSIDTVSLNVWRQIPVNKDSINLYQVGNNKHHWEIIKSALARPGIVVIHDGSLSGVLETCDQSGYIRFCEYELGRNSAAFLGGRSNHKIFAWQGFVIRNLGLLVDSSLACIVHSIYLEKLIRRRYRSNKVFRVNHHLSELFRRPDVSYLNEGAQRFFSRCPNALIIATFGFLTPPKRLDWIIEAFGRLLSSGVDAVLILGGEPHPDTDIPRLIKKLPSDRVYISGFLPERELLSLMSMSDVQISLRFPSVGETSGILTRAIGLGVPSIVLDFEAFSELPDEYVTKIPLSVSSPDKLAEALLSFAHDPARAHNKAASARDFAHRELTSSKSVRGYLNAISSVGSSPLLPSDLRSELSLDLLAAFNEPTQLQETSASQLVEKLMAQLFNRESVRRLAVNYRCDVLCLDAIPVLDDLATELELDHRRRKIVLVPATHETDESIIYNTVTNLGLSTFDVLCRFNIPRWVVSGVRQHRREESNGGLCGLNGDVRSSLRMVRRRSAVHLLKINRLVSIGSPDRAINIPISVVVHEVLR